MLPSSCSCSHSTTPYLLLQGRAAPLCGPRQYPHGSLCAYHITFSSRPPRFLPQTSSFLCKFDSNDSCTHCLQFLSICPRCEMRFACHCSICRVLHKITRGLQFSALLLPEPLETASWQFTASSLAFLPLEFEVLR